MLVKSIQLYKNAFSGLNRQIWLLAIVMLINRCGTMVLAFMTLYCNHLGYTLQQGGLVVAIYGAGSVVGALMGGKLSDEIGFYKVQVLALFAGGSLFILLGQMEGYTNICIVAFILAMVNESFRPANSTAIAHYSTKENRTQSYALVRLSVNLGWGIGIALGGFLASLDYSYIFWTDGITNILGAITLLLILPKVSLQKQKNPEQAEDDTDKSISPYKDKPFMVFLFFQFLFSVCFFQLFTTIPVFFKEAYGLSEFMIGAVMSINGVLIAVFEMVLVYKLENRKPYLVLMSYGSVLMGISFFLLLLPHVWGIYVAIAASVVITLAEMIAMPFMNSYYIARSTLRTRGRYAGLYTMTWSLSQMIGSYSGSTIAEKSGYNMLWLLVGFTALIAAVGYVFLYKKTVIVSRNILK